MPEARIAVADERVVLDAEGAIYLPRCGSLVVADLHLEKGSSYAARRVFLPPYDTLATLKRLAAIVSRRDPRRVICLGDSFHDRSGADRLDAEAQAALAAMQARRSWIWVSGNHDPEPPRSLAGEVTDCIDSGALRLRHEPQPRHAPGEIAGHLHPSAQVRRSGRAVRRPAFATDGERLVLPAFGVLTGGLNVLDRAFAGIVAGEAARAFMMGPGRLFPVRFSALSPD